MKRISSCILVFTMIFGMLSNTVVYADNEPTDAELNANPLIASIKFDNNLKDDANQEILTANGNYSFVDGVLPGTKALHLESGDGNYVGTTHSLSFGNDSFTTSFWYKGDTKNNQVILSNKDFTKGSNEGWAIYTSANSVNMNLGFPTASVKNISFGRDTFDASAWRYVTFVVDRNKMLASLYIDGYEMAESTLAPGSLDTSNPLNIGSDGLGTHGGNSFDIADLTVWKGAFSSDEVQAKYNSYGVNKVDMNALNDTISEANTIVAGGLGDGFSETDFDYLKKVLNMATTVATTQKVKLYTQETINYYERELNNAIFIYQKSNKTLTPADLNITDSSDPEISSNPATIARVEEDYRKVMKVFPQADVLVQPGDITGGNNANEYVWMGELTKVYNKLKAEGLFNTTKLYIVKGNHDMNGTEKLIPVGTAGAWNESTNSYDNDFYNSAYRVKIKGYNLIGFDANINSSSTVGKAKDYLNQIKSEADYDPKKPIFAMSHYPISGTVWGSAWSSGASNNFGQFIADNNFSQVFYMSGHTQYDPTDERSLYQGAASFLDSGGSNYSSYQDDGPFGGYIEGSYGSYHTTPRISNFIEVYGTKLILKQYNLATDEFVSIPRVINVGEGKDAFSYSKRDIRELIAPQFDEGIKIDSLNANEVAFTIKQANDNVRVMEYNIQLINKLTGKVEKSFNSLSYPMDKPYDVYRQYKFTNLSPGTPYIIRVFADDSVYNRSSQDIEINVNSVNLNSITAPASVSANNGTAKTAEALGLPIKVILATDGGNVDASVNWDLSGISYDPAIKTEQTFSVPGTVTLPFGVENPNSVPLTTSINVTVKEVGVASDHITLDKSQYIQGEAITLSYTGAALNGKDWVGIYRTGAVPPGAGVSLIWSYLKSGSGRVSLNNGLAPGTYDALFLLNDGYTVVDRKTFRVVQRVPVSGVTLDQQNVTMTQGETRTLTAAVTPANANDTRVSWISSDPTVVSINSTGSSASLIGNRPGTVTVTVKTLDGNFTASANVTVNPIEVEHQPPTTTDNAPSGWVNQDVIVTLSASDNESGVANTYYIVDDSAEQTGTSVVLSEEGVHKLEYWSVDKAGNVERAHTVSISIDKTAPSIAVSVPGDNSIYEDSGELTPQITLTDNLSDVDSSKTTVTLDSHSYQIGTMFPLYTLPLGQHTLVVSSSDLAGNQVSKTVQFTTEASIDSLKALVSHFATNKEINNAGIANSLQSKLEKNNLNSFVNEVQAQSGKHISSEAAEYLLRDAQYVLTK